MSIAQFVNRGKRSFSNIFRFSYSVQKYKNSYCYVRNVTFLFLEDLLVLCKGRKDPL